MPAIYRPSLLMGVNLGLTVLCVAGLLAWSGAIGFALPPWSEYAPLMLAGAAFGAMGLFYATVRVDEPIARAMLSIAIFIVFMPCMSALTYLGATLRFPMADEALVAIDRAMGFDWLAMLHWSLDYPGLIKLLNMAYRSPYADFPFVIMLVLFAMKRTDMLEEMIGFIILSSVITLVVGSLVPALPAYVHFQVPLEISARIGTALDQNFGPAYFAIRDGIQRGIDLEHPRALVAFPSHHSVVAVMLSLYLRHNRYLLAAMLPVTLAVLASTPLIGGHYLIDTLAGIATAFFACWLARKLLARPLPLPRLASAQPLGQGATG